MLKRLILIIILSNSLKFNPEALLTLALKKMLYDNLRKMSKEGFISQEIFIYFFINSDSILTQTQMLTLKLSPNRILTQSLTKILILTPKTANEKSANQYFSFSFYSL